MMGKVLDLVIGFDDKVRTVKLKQGNGLVEYHSISNLYPMELSVSQETLDRQAPEEIPNENVSPVDETNLVPPHGDNNDVSLNNQESGRAGSETQPSSRPKRKATERFRRIMADNLEYL